MSREQKKVRGRDPQGRLVDAVWELVAEEVVDELEPVRELVAATAREYMEELLRARKAVEDPASKMAAAIVAALVRAGFIEESNRG